MNFIETGPTYSLDHDGIGYRNATVADLRRAGLAEPIILDLVKDRLKTMVDELAEAKRAEIVTAGAGQAMEYQEAQAQAAAALKVPSSATPEKYPMLAATIGVDIDPTTGAPATDVLGVARSIDGARTAWVNAGAEIRGARLGLKAAIKAAPTVEAALAVFDGNTLAPAA